MTRWVCNLCNARNTRPFYSLEREGPSCGNCGSSVRQRQIVLQVLKISKLKASSRDLRLIGLSDSDQVSQYLSKKWPHSYSNTFYDTEPLLDITSPGIQWQETADILISSDVLEHVFHPIANALNGKKSVLKPGGKLILTVPYTFDEPNREHYPWMVSYEVFQAKNKSWQVRARNALGDSVIVENPIFHGGPGNTLEMRLLSRAHLLEEVKKAGFKRVRLIESNNRRLGIRMQMGVLVATKPRREKGAGLLSALKTFTK